jgi:hypothetical protein
MASKPTMLSVFIDVACQVAASRSASFATPQAIVETLPAPWRAARRFCTKVTNLGYRNSEVV